MVCRTAVALIVFLASSPAYAQPAATVTTIPAKFDDLYGYFLLIPIAVNGTTFWCDVDSGGSGVFSLDEREGERAGFKPDSSRTSAGVGAAVIADKRMRGALVRIGDVSIPNQTIVMRPYPPEIPEMDCIVGLGVLREYAVQFDYVTPAIRLYRAAEFRPPAQATVIPFIIDRNNPIGDASVLLANGDTVRASLRLDNGASYYSAVFMPPFIRANRLAERVGPTAKRPDRAKGTGGSLSIVAARAPQIAVGSARVDAGVIGLIETESAGFPWDGLVGAGFFRKFTSTFDFSRRQLFLEPNGLWPDAQEFDASGVSFDIEGDTTVVGVVVPDSPAAGRLREGDVLRSVDGASAAGLTTRQLTDILSRPGKECVLRVRRGEETLTITLQLVKRL